MNLAALLVGLLAGVVLGVGSSLPAPMFAATAFITATSVCGFAAFIARDRP